MVGMAASFLLYPFLVERLGESRYGVWALLSSATGYLGVFDAGFAASITKYVAQYKGQDDVPRLRSVIWAGTRLYFLISIPAALAAAVFYFIFPMIFSFEPELMEEALPVLAVVSVDVVLSLWFTSAKAALNGLQRFDVTSGLHPLATLARAGIVVLLVLNGHGLLGLGVTLLAVNRCYDLLMLYFLRRELKILTPGASSGKIDKVGFGLIVSYSAYAIVSNIASRLFYYTDNFVIGLMLTSAHITHFVLAFTLINIIRNLTDQLMRVMMPAVSEISTLGEEEAGEKLRKMFTSGSRFAGAFSLPLLMILLVTGNSFIRAWMGPGFEDSYWCLVVMAVPQIWILSQNVGIKIIFGLGEHKNYSLYSLAVAILNLAISLALAPYLGILGVAFGTAAPIFIGRLYMDAYFERILKIHMPSYYWQTWRRLGPLGIIFGCLLYVQFIYLDPRGLIWHLAIYGVNFAAFEAAAFFLVLEPGEKRLFIGVYRALEKRIKNA